MHQQTKKKLVVLTGAGISAESGIRTFRDSGGVPYVQESVWTRLKKTADVMVGRTSMPRQKSVSDNRRPGLAGDVPSVAAETV